MPSPDTAVLVISFGGPTKKEEIRPFLDIVLKGRPTPRERYEEVVHHYELIGGASPINAITEAQAAGLRRELASSEAGGPAGAPLPVYVGMRNWHPFIGDVLEKMAADGVRRVIGLILSAHRSEASIKRYTDTVDEALARLGPRAPKVDYAGPWFDHPLFIEAIAARIDEAYAGAPAERLRDASWIFTAHSIPVAMPGADQYQADLRRTIEQVCARYARTSWTLAWQSRSGAPHTPWLGPDVCEVIRAEAKRGAQEVFLIPIGFVADHVEVLFDLDVEAKQAAADAGVRFTRAQTVGDHPAFARMLADVVRRRLAPVA